MSDNDITNDDISDDNNPDDNWKHPNKTTLDDNV